MDWHDLVNVHYAKDSMIVHAAFNTLENNSVYMTKLASCFPVRSP